MLDALHFDWVLQFVSHMHSAMKRLLLKWFPTQLGQNFERHAAEVGLLVSMHGALQHLPESAGCRLSYAFTAS